MVATVEHHSHDPVPSHWPIITAIGVGLIPVGIVASAHGWKGGLAVIAAGLFVALSGAGRWWGELLRDKFFGRDAVEADSRLKRMFAFFIASEAMIFGAFFAALFYARHHAKIWPPEGMPHFEILVPAVNTVILLSSSVTLHLGRTARRLDPQGKRVTDDQGTVYGYGNLLLATGGTPRRLPFGGAVRSEPERQQGAGP